MRAGVGAGGRHSRTGDTMEGGGGYPGGGGVAGLNRVYLEAGSGVLI